MTGKHGGVSLPLMPAKPVEILALISGQPMPALVVGREKIHETNSIITL